VKQPLPLPLLAAALSGVLLAASFPPHGLWPLAWTALVPLFFAALRSASPGRAGFLGAVTGAFFYPAALSWMTNIFNPAVSLLFWAIFALWLALHAALLKFLWDRVGAAGRGRWGELLWTLLAGAAWAGLEYFRSEAWPLACPWLGLGYSQMSAAPVLQTTSVWGVYGLSAFIASVNAAWVLLLQRRYLAPILAVFLCALVSAWGRERLASFDADAGRPVKAALLQDETLDLESLLELSLSPAAAGADLLVWPEYAFYMKSGEEGKYSALIAERLGPRFPVSLIASGVQDPGEVAAGRGANFVLALGPRGENYGRYDKLHPVPFVDDGLTPNPAPAPLNTPLGGLGVQICYDLAFEDGPRKVTVGGAEILISPTKDPMRWGLKQHLQHSDMSAARAVETGLWILRPATSGISQIIDPLGEVRAVLPAGERGVLAGSARLREGGTFYTAYGWLFGPLSMALTLGLGLWALFPRRR